MSKELGERIRMVRTSSGLSQEEFGRNIGISKPAISLIEAGKNNPSEQTLLFICNRYGINESWLRNGEGEMKADNGEKGKALAWVHYVFDREPESLKRRILGLLVNASDSQWDVIKSFADYLSK